MAVYRVSVSVMYLDPTRSVHRVHGVHGKGIFFRRQPGVNPRCFLGVLDVSLSMVKKRMFFLLEGGGKSSDMFMWRTKNMSAMMVFLGGLGISPP